ncbi:conserved protein, unknown function [Plasmodium yoelii]|uniref:Calponin-homology (CH) domain-containing protein n=1 Tax=Plasmodium yoelii TaxID=5861 RepID=A0A077Y448_PLAYE|nr:conserved protein, unknown function [Plasmodium yoelii]CDU17695.1 conserved protein, unknown function [Plasmodium yoelii]VTZ77670.1 conserved protein, unknown function [Plasmodium yoelii]|eukprot:XP_022812029.1 conserved protein, unknown function [Plasmodium yoelii]
MSKNELVKVPSKVREEELNDLHDWINSFTLSRKIKNINRDFSDGVLMAELVNICLPKFVEIHNYSKANSINQKTYNWNTLNEKVFKRLSFKIDKKNVEEIVNCKYMGVEKVLITFKDQLQKYKSEIKDQNNNLLNKELNKLISHETEIPDEENQNLNESQNPDPLNNNEIVEILREKIFNLEKLLKIKENKIDILNKKIEALNKI